MKADLYNSPQRHWQARLVALFLVIMLVRCGGPAEEESGLEYESLNENSADFFFMRNAEIREDILVQLEKQGIEHWLNDDNSVGFYVRDTERVDQIATEAINVWISFQ